MLEIDYKDAGDAVARHIQCADELCQLADEYFWSLLAKVFGTKGTPPSSARSSAPSSGASTPRRQKFSEEIRKRDNFRCAYTGFYDNTEYPNYDGAVSLEAVHIIGHSTISHEPFWALLQQCHLDDLLASREIISDPRNGFLLYHPLHESYDKVGWYIEVDARDGDGVKYYARFLKKGLIRNPSHFRLHMNGSMDFSPDTSRNDDIFELKAITNSEDIKLHINGAADNRPCPNLLKLREILSKVLHASGRVGELDQELDEDYQLSSTASDPGFLDKVARKLATVDSEQTSVDL
ncbi:hypothetical protein HDV05_000271 [Chytridiales sp. JEL 0842]|nr:hypothetical protein HDV05_000271 [Chytridiales sp. JEL 0842]